MRRISSVLSLASFGLLFGCGDNGGDTQTTTVTTTTMTSITTIGTSTDATGTATMGGMTGSSVPTTTEPTGGSVGMTESGGTVNATEASTGQVSVSSTSAASMTMGGTTGGTTDDTTMSTPCDEINVTLMPVIPNVMLVTDKSGSMLTLWDHDANANTPTVTRWYSLWAVVDQVLTAFEQKFNFGLNLFPSTMAQQAYNSTACPVNANVEVPVAAMNKGPIQAALPAQNNMTIKGGTPAAAGLTAAINHLKTLDPLIPRIIMFITDGASNCSSNAMSPNELFEVYDANVPTIVGNAFTMDSIPTYVIGIATQNAVTPNQQDGNPNGINPYDKLNELATLGGTAKPGPEKFYNADNQIELADALNAIVADAFSCTIELPSEPAFPDKTVVKVGGMTLGKVMDCTMENGWKYKDPAPPYEAIEICGTACDQLKMSGSANVQFFCDAG